MITHQRFFLVALASLFTIALVAQDTGNTSALRAGTQITAELQSTVDARTAKPNGEVVARVTKNVKQNGRTVVHKGDRLIGKIDSVESSASADASSRMSVTFDRLVQGQSVTQLNAVVSAVLSTPAEQRAQEMSAPEPMMAPAPMAGPAPAPSSAPGAGSRGNGGLLGGVTSTVGATAGAAGSVTGPVLSGASGTVDSTTRTTVNNTTGAAVATPRRMIRLDSQAQAEHSSSTSSVFSSRQGPLHLDSGTRMQFRVAGSTTETSHR